MALLLFAQITYPFCMASTKKNAKRPRRLGELSPTEFENLLYDLMIAKGMVNVVWRTPGADGGRDIEAEVVQLDLSGVNSFARWYIECKRYKGSVDWPTIHPKLAYADAASAEYLLLATTSKFTPQAINSCNQWNASRRYPKLRLWAGQDVEAQLVQFPDLQYRYGLIETPSNPGQSLVAISLALSKAVGSFYSHTVTTTEPANRMLRAAFGLALLLQFRMEDVAKYGSVLLRPLHAVEGLAIDADFSGVPQSLDEPAFVAFCSYLCALTKTRLHINFDGSATYTVTGYHGFSDILERYRDAFSSIALWGNFEFSFDDKKIMVRQR